MPLGVPELLIILTLVAVFFGAGKLPQVMEAMGHGIKQFRKASESLDAPPGSDEPPPERRE